MSKMERIVLTLIMKGDPSGETGLDFTFEGLSYTVSRIALEMYLEEVYQTSEAIDSLIKQGLISELEDGLVGI